MRRHLALAKNTSHYYTKSMAHWMRRRGPSDNKSIFFHCVCEFQHNSETRYFQSIYFLLSLLFNRGEVLVWLVLMARANWVIKTLYAKQADSFRFFFAQKKYTSLLFHFANYAKNALAKALWQTVTDSCQHSHNNKQVYYLQCYWIKVH